ncbi:MAG: gamma-glutamyltransferase family protein [Bryobacter sp.]|nr:gamma-glutamyltransferase family protein [Bryobacter sp.]
MRTLLLLLGAASFAFAQYSMFPAVRGTREMVAAANNFEVEAGWRILMQGGNAVDAGVAAVLAAAVTEQARFGLGGEMPLLLKMKGRPVEVISAVGTAPALATVDHYRARKPEPWEQADRKPPIPAQGIQSAILPGVVSGLLITLAEHGTLSFAQVAQPAIEYAEGFPLGEEFAFFIRNTERILSLWPDSKSFFMPGGAPPPRGSILKLPSLANTLRQMAAAEKKARGNRRKKIEAVHDLFYKGAIAKKLAAYSEANNGLIRLNDLAAFRAEKDAPRTATYRGYEIAKPGFWTQGPVMLQALQILEGFDLKAMGHNSPEYLHTVLEAVKLAFADRDRHYGDPKFSKVPEQTLLSADYAAARRKLIDPAKASLESRPGDLPGAVPWPPEPAAARGSDQDTTCVNVVDRFGNVFSATPSGAWLPSVIAGDTGIPFSTRLQSFVLTPGHANQLAPGKRPRVTLSPTIVLKNGEPVLAMSTPGGDNQDQAMLQVLLNLIEFGMSPQEAVEAPRFQTEHFYSSFAWHDFNAGRVTLENRIPRATVEALRAKGHLVSVAGEWSNSSAPTVIRISPGVLEGAADPRRGRYVFGR